VLKFKILQGEAGFSVTFLKMSPAVAGFEFNRINPSTISSMYVKSQTKLPWLKTFISSPAIIALLKKEAPCQSGPKEHRQ
jgi:hypothetical protein